MAALVSVEELQNEVSRLRGELEKERLARAALEEECDLLAEENERLRGLQAQYGVPCAAPSANTTTSSGTAEDALEVFVNDAAYAESVQTRTRQVENACGGKNVTATAIFSTMGREAELDTGDIVFCGGVDSVLHGLDLETGVELIREKVNAPVLTIACSATHVAAGMMDGSMLVMPILSSDVIPVVQRFQEHGKYLVSAKWDASGKYLASAAHDKTVTLFRVNPLGEVEKHHTMHFSHTPESVCFTKPAEGEIVELIIGLRGVSYLVYVNVDTLEQRHVSLNENEWDTHVSLTPLYLSLSPCGRYLCVATDKHMHILLRVGTNKRVRVLSGHVCGDYGKPTVVWDYTGNYIYCNSDEDSGLYVYSVATERVIKKLQGHKGIVRSLAAHPHKAVVSTASYDKTVAVWK